MTRKMEKEKKSKICIYTQYLLTQKFNCAEKKGQREKKKERERFRKGENIM